MLTSPWSGFHPRESLALITAIATLVPAALASDALGRDVQVTDYFGGTVFTIDSTSMQLVEMPIGVGNAPSAIAITPDGRFAYVTNELGKSVSVIDIKARQPVGPPIVVGESPNAIAITPDGRFAFVVNRNSSSVSVIDTQIRQTVGSPMTVGLNKPIAIAITPDGRFAYVANEGGKSVSVINLQTRQPVGLPIVVGESPHAVAISPDGGFAYVTNRLSHSVSVIDTQTRQVVGSPIAAGEFPNRIAISPDGRFAYVVSSGSSDVVTVIDTQTRLVVGSPISVGTEPQGIAITPDGRFAYVANAKSGSASVIDTQAKLALSPPVKLGLVPFAVAVTPDQPPVASFSVPVARPGVPATFDAVSASDPDGAIVRYDWTFGDGTALANGGTRPQHSYAAPGTYPVSLAVTDNEGCSTSLIFTGQTAYCNGSAAATREMSLTVSYPTVRVRCPKRARPGGCRFRIQAVTKKRKGKAQTAVARARVRAGQTALVSLIPKKTFMGRLASAQNVLVRKTVTIDGARRTSFRRLPIVG